MKNAIKYGLCFGISGLVISGVITYFLIPIPLVRISNTISNCILGLLTGFMGGFFSITMYLKALNKEEN